MSTMDSQATDPWVIRNNCQAAVCLPSCIKTLNQVDLLISADEIRVLPPNEMLHVQLCKRFHSPGLSLEFLPSSAPLGEVDELQREENPSRLCSEWLR